MSKVISTTCASPAIMARTASNGRFRIPRHIAAIDQAIIDTLTGKSEPILLIEAPPRHGKSELVSRFLPAWYLGVWPERRVMLAAYEATFARSWGRKARQVFHESAGPLFSRRLSADNTAADDWSTTDGGGMTTAGVGGPMTGRGANLLIIDDPVKNAEEALSQTTRNNHWDWWQSTASTRLEPGGVVIGIMCMTGDTSVMMADGTTRRLDDVKPMDRIATYANGILASTKVMAVRSNGHDLTWKITTKSGKMVVANGRHPFLTMSPNGELSWTRLRSLTTAHKIVTARASGENGEAFNAPLMDAKSLPSVEECAKAIIPRSDGPTGIVAPQTHMGHVEMRGSSTDTASLPSSMMKCIRRKMDVAQSARHQQLLEALPDTGEINSLLTTATKLERSGGCCAINATLESDTLELSRWHWPLPHTSDFILDEVVGIEECGRHEVFDLQVEHTENFIANGVVSHNTRWHEDDIFGRLLKGGGQIRRLTLPALAEHDDPLGRNPGEALWPERYPAAKLEQMRAERSEYWWRAMYQQRPGKWGESKWGQYLGDRCMAARWPDAFDVGVVAVDPSLGADDRKGDYSAIVFVGRSGGRLWIDADIRRRAETEIAVDAVAMYQRHQANLMVLEGNGFQRVLGESFQSAAMSAGCVMPLQTIVNTGNKVLRVSSLGPLLAADLFRFRDNPGTRLLLDQLGEFPRGDHDDGPDALEMAVRCLNGMVGEPEDAEDLAWSG